MNIFDLALVMTPRLGANEIQHLLERFDSAESIFRCSEDELVNCHQLNRAIAKSIVSQVAMPKAEIEIAHCKRHNIKMIASTDSDYPQLLRDTYDPPHVIFVLGDHTLLNRRSIALVGTRSYTAYGERSCKELVDGLANQLDDIVIVSGLTEGIDGVAHRSAIEADLPTIAVLPTALPKISPSRHQYLAQEILNHGGALISEVCTSTPFSKDLHIKRNRIIAAISSATVIVESEIDGGSIRTAKFADGYNRTLFAVPGRMSDSKSSGCNLLISMKIASICLSYRTILYEMGWEGSPRKSRKESSPLPEGVEIDMLSAEHMAIIKSYLDGDGKQIDEALHISEIESRSGLPISKVNGLMVELELFEIVSAPLSARYELLISIDELPTN